MTISDVGATTARRMPIAADPELHSLAFAAVSVSASLPAFGSAFGGIRYYVVGILGMVIGAGLLFLGGRVRLPVWARVATLFLAAAALSGLVLPNLAAAGFLPTVHSVSNLFVYGVRGWKALLSTSTPVGTAGSLLALPFLVALVASALTYAIGLTRAALAAVLPPLGLLAIGIAFGTSQTPRIALDAAVLAAVSLLWLGRSSQAKELIGSRSGMSTALAGGVVLLAGVIAVPLSAVLPGAAGARVVIRDHIHPPFDAAVLPSPLSAFRQYVVGDRTKPLFTVTGLPPGARVRLATMDSYNGIVYGTDDTGITDSGLFDRVGSTIPASPCPTEHCMLAKVHIVIQHLSGVWLPDAGSPTRFQFAGAGSANLAARLRFNPDTDGALLVSGVSAGDAVSEYVSLPRLPSPASLAGAPVIPTLLPPVEDLPPDVAKKAQSIAGSGSDFAKATALCDWLRQGAYTDGGAHQPPSLPGHYAWRLAQMVAVPQPFGDGEQYAALMALMARSIGLPARVVLGAIEPKTGGPLEVTGSKITAWVEIPFQGAGWYPFDPTPNRDSPLRKVQRSSSQTKPPPQSLNQSVSSAGTGSNVPAKSPATKAAKRRPTHILPVPFPLAVVVEGGGPVLLLILVIGCLLVVKTSARRRRRTVGSPRSRIVGGWVETLCVARDLGIPVPRTGTRSQVAASLGESALPFAMRSDLAAFGPDMPADEEAVSYWQDLPMVLNDLRQSRSAWRRTWSRVNPASLLDGLRDEHRSGTANRQSQTVAPSPPAAAASRDHHS